jgi:hypothetical protein
MHNEFVKLHHCIADTESIIQVLNGFNETVHSAGMYFRLDVPDEDGGIAYPNNEIPDKAVIVIGSFDFSYYHQIEIVFFETLSHTISSQSIWSDHWDKAQLTLIQGIVRHEVLAKHQLSDDESLHVFAFNIGSFGDEQYYIIAKGISIKLGVVFHYDRAQQEALKSDERVAYWVYQSSK